jgi:glutaredoxin
MVQKKSIKDYLITGSLILLCVWSAWNFISKGSVSGNQISEGMATEIHDTLGSSKLLIEALEVSSKENAFQQKPVVLFVTSWCGVCHSLERKLRSENIVLKVVDIEKNHEARVFYQASLGSQSGPVPATLVGTQVFIGDQSRAIISRSRAT